MDKCFIQIIQMRFDLENEKKKKETKRKTKGKRKKKRNGQMLETY